MAEIPAEERLITVEDAAELSIERHPNFVQLFIPRMGRGWWR